MPGRLWNQICHGAALRAIPLKLTIQDAWDLFLRQSQRCVLSGLLLEMAKNYREHGTASLDRIDSTKPYEMGNVQWVHKDINMMKQQMTQEAFVNMCRAVAANADKTEVAFDQVDYFTASN